MWLLLALDSQILICQKRRNITATFWLELLNIHFSALIEFKIISVIFCVMSSTVLPISRKCNVASMPLLYFYCHDKCSDDLHSLLSTVQTFISRRGFNSSMLSNHLYLLHVRNGRWKFYTIKPFLNTYHYFKWNLIFWLLQESIPIFLHTLLIFISYQKPYSPLLFC